MTDADKILAAQDALGRACKDGGRIHMSIPVRPDDTDIVIAEGLKVGLAAVLVAGSGVGPTEPSERAIRHVAAFLGVNGGHQIAPELLRDCMTTAYAIDTMRAVDGVRAGEGKRITELENALRNVIAHTAYLPHASRELLEGLLASCARIARAELPPPRGPEPTEPK